MQKRKKIKKIAKLFALHAITKKKNFLEKNITALFYGWGSSRLEPLRGGSLPFTTKFPEIPGTQFIDLKRMEG